MSVFNSLFKLKNNYEYEKQKALNIIMNVTHNKLTLKETERIYDILSSKAMTLDNDDSRIKESMRLITDLKADWLTTEEKQNFVASVWLCECATDSKNNKGITYINDEEVKYTRYAILGSKFNSIN